MRIYKDAVVHFHLQFHSKVQASIIEIMNLFLALTLMAAAVAAQEQCGCAPQPVVIQLSCDGNDGFPKPPPHHPPPHHPPPPPHHPPPQHPPPPPHHPPSAPIDESSPSWEAPSHNGDHEHEHVPESYNHNPSHWNMRDDPDRSKCVWRNNGADSFFLHGDVTNDYYLSSWHGYSRYAEPDRYDRIRWYRKDMPKPPRNWDGSSETLGFPAPERGTELYKLLLCWPLLSSENEHNSTEVSIKDDPDVNKCQWIWTEEGPAYQRGQISGGFPSGYAVYNSEGEHRNFVEAPGLSGAKRPPLDWDGRASTLGFEMPKKGTQEYNMLLCWPFDFRFGPPQEYPQLSAGK